MQDREWPGWLWGMTKRGRSPWLAWSLLGVVVTGCAIHFILALPFRSGGPGRDERHGHCDVGVFLLSFGAVGRWLHRRPGESDRVAAPRCGAQLAGLMTGH